ncbi:MAG: hypothetical protein V1701_12315 [Planctomycetota bacterium]
MMAIGWGRRARQLGQVIAPKRPAKDTVWVRCVHQLGPVIVFAAPAMAVRWGKNK